MSQRKRERAKAWTIWARNYKDPKPIHFELVSEHGEYRQYRLNRGHNKGIHNSYVKALRGGRK